MSLVVVVSEALLSTFSNSVLLVFFLDAVYSSFVWPVLNRCSQFCI